MNQLTLRQRFTTGRSLWLMIAVALGLALGSQAATARECYRETPLPADVRLTAPGPEVPEAVARFAGAWSGAWLDKGKEALCHTLVVEEVYANGIARVIVSGGTYADWDVRLPGFLRVTGRIVDGELRFSIDGIKLAYRVADEALQGKFDHPDGTTGGASLSRVADVSQVGCGSQAWGLPPAPPATGPRDRLTAAELLGADAGSGPQCLLYARRSGRASPAPLHRDGDGCSLHDVASPPWLPRSVRDPARLHGRLLHAGRASGAGRARHPASPRHPDSLPGPGVVGARRWRPVSGFVPLCGGQSNQ
jgi:hypothetical protein